MIFEFIWACISIFYAITTTFAALDEPTTWNVGMSIMWIIITIFWFVFFFTRKNNNP